MRICYPSKPEDKIEINLFYAFPFMKSADLVGSSSMPEFFEYVATSGEFKAHYNSHKVSCAKSASES